MWRGNLVRLAIAILAVTAATLGLAQRAAASAPRVAIVQSSALGPFVEASEALTAALRRDPLQPEILTFDLAGDPANAPALFARVETAAPRLVVTVGSLATNAALDAKLTAPVVFAMVLYPEASGFLHRNGKTSTGASLDIPPDVQFRLLRRLLPKASRVGVLYHPSETGPVVEAARRAVAAHGFTLVARPVADPGAAPAALDELMAEVDAIWTVADSHVFTAQTTAPLILATLRRGIPLLGLSTAQVRAGAVAALYCDYADIGRQAAEVAARVLAGANPSDVPVTVPRVVRLALNTRTAEHLGLPLAADLVKEADEVMK